MPGHDLLDLELGEGDAIERRAKLEIEASLLGRWG